MSKIAHFSAPRVFGGQVGMEFHRDLCVRKLVYREALLAR